MRELVFVVIVFFLAGCVSTVDKDSSAVTADNYQVIQPPQWNVSVADLSESGQRWLTKIKQYDRADSKLVKQPFAKIVEQLNNWPEEQYCTPQHHQILIRALGYNPTSLLAYSMEHHCAVLKEDQQRQDEVLDAIQGISEVLFASGSGAVLTEPLMVRYAHEGALLFQWAGYHIFDMELVEFKHQLLYKLHGFDVESGVYSAFYVQNTQFMLYSSFTSLPANLDKAQQTALLLKGLLEKDDPLVRLWKMKQALLAGNYQTVVDQLQTKSDLSPLETVLISQAALNLANERLLDEHLDDLITFSERRFVDASAALGQYLLSTGDVQESRDAANLFHVNVVDQGHYYGTESWMWNFLSQPYPHPLFKQLISQLDEQEMFAWYRQVVNFRLYHPTLTSQLEKSLIVMLKAIADEGQGDAQIEYAYVLLDGGLGQSADIAKGIDYIKYLAQQGQAQAQLEMGVLISQGKYGLSRDRAEALRWYTLAAEQGNERAAYNLGLAYRYATGVEQNIERALEYFNHSYDAGFSLAGCRIGDIYSEVEGYIDFDKAVSFYQAIAEDENLGDRARSACAMELAQLANYELKQVEQAVFWWEQAGKWGNDEAYFELGLHYSDLTAEDANVQKAISFYEQAVKMGNHKAAANLGYMYENGDGVEKNTDTALQYYRFSASGNSSQGINNYATFLRYGTSTEKDPQKAKTLYLKAYAMGNDYAANNLADMYYFGELGEPDFEQACNYYEEAVKRKFISALYDLAYCHFYGEGRPQNTALGLQLLEQSSQAGNTNALNELGEIYMFGRQVEKQNDKALGYFKQAFEEQSVNAAYNLGLMYENGLGVQKDPVLALVYYEQSAKWGYVNGMLATAKAYLYGVGTRKSVNKAKYWLEKAAQNGSSGAKDLMESL